MQGHISHTGDALESCHTDCGIAGVAGPGYSRPSNVQRSGMRHWCVAHVQWDWQSESLQLTALLLSSVIRTRKTEKGLNHFLAFKGYHRGERMNCSPCLWYTGWKGMALNASRRFPVRHWLCFLMCKNYKALKWVTYGDGNLHHWKYLTTS